MDEYYHLVRQLPNPMGSQLGALSAQIAPFVQEIRLRVGQPLLFTMKGRLTPCTKFLPGADFAAKLERESLRQCFLSLCRHSVYAYEEELRKGYFTIPGGNRVGVAGVWGPHGFSVITSLSLRVARWITCDLPAQVLQPLSVLQRGILVAGLPGSGKTTFLRTMIQYLGNSNRVFSVVDERGELLCGTTRGLPQEHEIRCDVYTQLAKAKAISMALRCMNPQVIICDELGTEADVQAVEQGLASGVVFLASVHCDTPENLYQKPQIARLLAMNAFGTVVFLDGREHPGTVAKVVTLP